MNNLLPGDIIFTRDTFIISRLIRWFTGGDYSHCFVYMGDGLILESGWNGVVITGLKRYINNKTTCTAVRLDKGVDVNNFLQSVKRRVGDYYDYKLFFGHLAMTLGRIIRLETYPYDSPSKWLCYEVIGQALSDIGVDFDRPVFELNPHKLFNKLKKDGAKIWML